MRQVPARAQVLGTLMRSLPADSGDPRVRRTGLFDPLRCPDARGIIHAISGALTRALEHTNESTGVFVMRTRFEASPPTSRWYVYAWNRRQRTSHR